MIDMRKFHSLTGWNGGRDFTRRCLAGDFLLSNGIEFESTSPGHFKIKSCRCVSLMFYPKSGKIVWKTHDSGMQHVFQSNDEGALLRKIKDLV